MPILNYTTKISPEKTVSEIQARLVKNGARQMNFDYSEDGILRALTFRMDFDAVPIYFSLTPDFEGVLRAMQRQKAPKNLLTIEQACRGCHFNKEEILKKMFHELWIVFKRPFSAHEIQTCENILRDFDTSKLTTEKPELFWGRFFVPDSSGWVTRDEAEESAEELCGLINITVNIQYEFEER